MRAISSTLLAAQRASSRTPYIKMLFTSKDGLTTRDFSMDSAAYGDRIVSIDHREEAYNDYAIVILRDYDSTLPDVTGYWTEIGYGLTTGAGNEYLLTQPSRLWVKHQRHVSAGGRLLTILELEGLWTKIIETLLRMGTAPYYIVEYAGASTVYAVALAVMKEVFGGTNPLAASPPNDGIITTLCPIMTVNSSPFEYADVVIYRLLKLTKCFLRSQLAASYPEEVFKVIYPQAADAADEIYYSSPTTSQSGFYSFWERQPTLTPNHVITFYGRSADGTWPSPVLYGEAVSQPDIDKYTDVYRISVAPDVTTAAMANLLSEAFLARDRAEQDTGFASVPHDGRVELYDKPTFVDSRGGGVTYPSHNLTRVGGLRHVYQPGKYVLEIYLGGVSTTSGSAEYTADTTIAGQEMGAQKVQQPKATKAEVEAVKRIAGPPAPTAFPGVVISSPAPAPILVASERTTSPQPETPTPTEPTLWQKLTPWNEQAGETLTSATKATYEKSILKTIVEAVKTQYEKSYLGRWIGGMFR